MQLRQQFQRVIRSGLDFVFPPRCAGCGRVDTAWCETCQAEMAAIPVTCETVRLEPFIAVAASGKHRGRLQDAVQALKYLNTMQVTEALGTRLAGCLQTQDWQIDLITAVPLHPDRLRVRGYNQAQKIAEALAKEVMLPCVPEALHRERHTRSQVGLNQQERLQNVEKAFVADAAYVAGKRVLLVDDVRSTGATLINCAEALQIAGATALYALTVTGA